MFLKIIFNKYGILVLGVMLLAIGIWQMNQTEVTCSGQVMVGGDTCEHHGRKGRVYTNTYEEEKASQALIAKGGVLGGPALIIGGIAWIVISNRRKSAEAQSAEAEPAATQA